MESSRLPRFKRASVVAPVEITERDCEIIRLVYQHRFLRSSHIANLVGGSLQQLLRRLQLLYHHGFLERPRAQLEYYHKGGTRQIAYGLGKKGASLLGEELDPVYRQLDWSEKNRSVGRIYLEHALFVSDVMVAIELACRQTGRIRLVAAGDLPIQGDARREHQSFRWRVSVSSVMKLGIIPDRVFALKNPDWSSNDARGYFFLEADRGTMPVTRGNLSQTSMRRKFIAYAATWSLSIHQTLFGFHRFRVLTVTNSPERVRSLQDACSKLERGHGLFLFADRTILDKPEDILSAVWQTHRPGETTSLLH
jgi:DNA-binding Lrp family transcriptional regulator